METATKQQFFNCPNHADPAIKCRYQISFRAGKVNYCPNCDAGPLWHCPECGELTDLTKRSCPNGHANTQISLPENIRKRLPAQPTAPENTPVSPAISDKAPNVRKSQAGHFSALAATSRSDFLPRFRTLLGDTYRAVAIAGADLRPVANFLESVRDNFRENNDTLAARASVDTLIGWNTNPQLEPVFLELRKGGILLLQDFWLTELRDAAAKSEADGWSLFVNRYAEALTFWRTRLCMWWADAAANARDANGKPLFSKKHEKELKDWYHNASLMDQGRWPEALPFIQSSLAGNTQIREHTRAFMLVICGSINLYHIDVGQVKSWLDKADALYSKLPYLQLIRAELERYNGNIETARTLANNYIADWPNDPEAYVSLGQGYQAENDLTQAIACYEKALDADPGKIAGYQYLVSAWASDPEHYARRQKEIPEIVERANTIDPENDINMLLSAGYAAESAKDLESARNWFVQALEKNPGHPEIMVALGNTAKTTALKSDPPDPEQIREATRWFDKAIETAPSYVYGYWNRAQTEEALGNIPEAARWFEKAIPHCPDFEKTLLVKAGELYLAAGDLPKATESGLKALRLDPAYLYAQNHLHTVVDRTRDASWSEETGPSAALQLQDTIRAIKGETYEVTYQNRTANIYYYFEEYQRAVEHYQKAIAIDPTDAVYFDNLAGALTKLDRIEEAWHMAEEALRLNPYENGYRKRTAELGRKVKAVRHFGVAPEFRSAVVDPIRIRFVEQATPYFATEGTLLPVVSNKTEALRKRFQLQQGFPLPPVMFAADHIPYNTTDNFSVELDGVVVSSDFILPGGYFAIQIDTEWLEKQGIDSFEHPGVPAIRWFDLQDASKIASQATTHGDYLDFLILLLENVLLSRSDLSDSINFDSGILSDRFIGESAEFTSKYLQFNRMVTKYRLSILREKETIFDVFKRCYDKGMTLQQMIIELFQIPEILHDLPVNRALREGNCEIFDAEPWQEEAIRHAIVSTEKGTLIWEVADVTPESAFSQLMQLLPDAKNRFIRTGDPEVVTVLNDIEPGCACLDAWILPANNEKLPS